MPITIGSNIASLQAQRRLSDSTSQLSRIYERLSSGMRINRASDDAAGLAIASQLDASARVFSQAVRNVNDGISMAAVAEGALGGLKDITTRQLELAEQAANGVYSSTQRLAMHREANELVKEYNRIVASAKFKGSSVFDLSRGAVVLQAGTGAEGALSMDLSSDIARTVGSGTFTAVRTDASGTIGNPGTVVSADFNNDGIADVATVGASIQIMLGNGDGTFKASVSYSGGSGSYNSVIRSADVNNDGAADLVYSDGFTSTMFTLLGNGNGTFKDGVGVTYGAGAYTGLDLADVNGDGKTDAIIGTNNNGLQVLLGNGNGTFNGVLTLAGLGNMNSVKSGDFNGDGKVDFVASTYNNSVLVYFGNGNGTFASALTLTTGGNTSRVVVGDLNGDFKDDIAVATYGGNSAAVLINNGNGTFKASLSFDMGGGVYTIALGDVNGDRLNDVIAVGYGLPTHVLFGNGDGTFSVGASSSPLISYEVALADFNRDGRLDMVSVDWGVDLQVLLGDPTRTLKASYLDLTTASAARGALDELRDSLTRIETQLGNIGAATSRFSAELSNLESQRINSLTAAGRIRDADIAAESSQLVRRQILQQAAAAVLSQANQQPQLALTLLRGG